MKSYVCEKFGIEFPLFAFSHCRDVVTEVSRAGGLGVFGALSLSPEQLEQELTWIDQHVDGKPYGVDVVVPNTIAGKGEQLDSEKILKLIPDKHKEFVNKILTSNDIDTSDLNADRQEHLRYAMNLQESGALELLDVAFSHPIKLIANALGVAPKIMLDMARKNDVAAAALVGTKEHAINQAKAGVDIIVAAGGEAGGHCGSVSTLVLIPEVIEAINNIADIPVLAAGGIVTGRQMAACMAMGASGAWTGSVWLTTHEAETNQIVKEKMLRASSRNTVRSTSRTGKPSRQLSSPWTDAWESTDSPESLPMPLQSFVSEPALRKIDKLADGGHEGAKKLATYWVGQGVGLMNQSMSVRSVVQDFQEDFINAYENLDSFITD